MSDIVAMDSMTPREIVQQLDRHIVGQSDAKRAVAIALRNRWRWTRLDEEVRSEVTPRNILMIGPTGVGKTEITRRLASLTGAPFVKVEATRFTEVGYYGRDVESIVRDLVEASVGLVRTRRRREIEEKAAQRVEDELLELLVPMPDLAVSTMAADDSAKESQDRHERTREKIRRRLRDGEMESASVELAIESRQSPVQVLSGMGNMEQMNLDLQGMFDRIVPRQQTRRKMTVAEARGILTEQVADSMLDHDAINEEAVRLAEENGMVFLDEIDKICSSEEGGRSADVSRQGVQRDLLPIVEGTTVQTRYGMVSTEKVLFIAAGAFHRSKPSDLMPELQGRFPIRVELKDLTREDFVRILTEPSGALTKQYSELLKIDGVVLEFRDDGIEALAAAAFRVNQETQNIGARRLQTIMERLLEDISFEAPDCGPVHPVIDAAFVEERLKAILEDEDLSQFIL